MTPSPTAGRPIFPPTRAAPSLRLSAETRRLVRPIHT